MIHPRIAFIVPSFAGILIFLLPVRWDGQLTIGIGIVTGWIRQAMGDYGLHLVIAIMLATSLLTLLTTFGIILRKPGDSLAGRLFRVPLVWLLLRIAGTVFGLFYFLQLGPELLRSEEIGGAVFVGIAVNVLSVYIGACLLLPLLTDFGFMEFAGTIARPAFRRAFRLPGRAAIDSLASFVGASAIGLLITIGQYERGRYTAREASVIATNFSVVSLPFSLVVARIAGIEQYFLPWYGVIVFACLVTALVSPRLPPLSRKTESRYRAMDDSTPAKHNFGKSMLQDAWQNAQRRAAKAPGIREYFRISLENLAFFAVSVIPAAMALATIAALITFHTPLFYWLGYPFLALLELAGLAAADAAVPGLFSGFMDQFMPAVAASAIDNSLTSFVLAGLSVCQLIYMSEVGVIILRSSLPLSFTDLVVIFLLRTAIVLPILLVGAHIVVG